MTSATHPSAKTYPPLIRHRMITRERARHRGGDAIGRLPLICVNAPAGSGKTSVMAEWFRSMAEGETVPIWVSLDANDTAPHRFFALVLDTVRRAIPGCGEEACTLLRQQPDIAVETVLVSFLNDLVGRERGIAVFLDDYHLAEEPGINAGIDFLLKYLPLGSSLILGSRRTPGIALARLRARGEVAEVGWEQLRFELGEVADYLSGLSSERLSETELAFVHDLTEGWAAGLQMAGLAMNAGASLRDTVSAADGGCAAMRDFLLNEVFLRQPSELREFLLSICGLDRFNMSLCDAVAERSDSGRMLETLKRRNLFIFDLDSGGHWQRFHHLFSAFLRTRQESEYPGRSADIFRRASEWYARHGMIREAFDHSVDGGMMERAAELLADEGRHMFRRGEFRELNCCVRRLPAEVVHAEPRLCALHAWALAYLGRFDQAKERLAAARKAQAHSNVIGADLLAAELRVLGALLSVIQNDEPQPDAVDEETVQRLGGYDETLKAFAAVMLGYTRRAAGDLPDALAWFRAAAAAGADAESPFVCQLAHFNVGNVLLALGRVQESERHLRDALTIAEDKGWRTALPTIFVRVQLGVTLCERGAFADALAELDEAIRRLEASEAFGFLGVALVERGRTLLAAGWPGVADDLTRARLIARTHNVTRVRLRSDLLEITLLINCGRAEEAAALWERVRQEWVSSAGEYVSERDEVLRAVSARVLLALSHFDEAELMAASGRVSAERCGRRRNRIEFLCQEAAAREGSGRRDEAASLLDAALTEAEPDHIMRPFLSTGGQLLPVLRRCSRRHGLLAQDLQTRLVAAETPSVGRPTQGFHLRETQILHLLALGMRNREIAGRLRISDQTVKWYLKSLFQKLDARTRTEAIAVGRQRGLLD